MTTREQDVQTVLHSGKQPDTCGTVELIRAYVEGYRGGRDAPGFDACVDAEINKRMAEQARIITEIGSCAGCFDPDSDEQVHKLALEWCNKFHIMKNRVAEQERLIERLVVALQDCVSDVNMEDNDNIDTAFGRANQALAELEAYRGRK